MKQRNKPVPDIEVKSAAGLLSILAAEKERLSAEQARRKPKLKAEDQAVKSIAAVPVGKGCTI